jgi:hypothetical protein
MMLTKLKIATGVLMISIGLLTGSAGLIARHAVAAQEVSPPKVLLGKRAGAALKQAATPQDLAKILAIEIDVKDFRQAMSFKEFVVVLKQKVDARGKSLPLFVDARAFREDDPAAASLWDNQVQFRPDSAKMSVHVALRTALSMFPVGEPTPIQRGGVTEVIAKGEPTFIIRDGRIEITTKRAAYKLADKKKSAE